MPAEFSGGSMVFYLSLGLLAGVFSALFGVGAGIIVVPALSLLTAVSQKEAQGIALTVMIPMALMGAFRYHVNPNIHVDLKLALAISITAVIGANIGATLADRLSNKTLQFLFAFILIIVAVRMIYAALK